MAAHQAPPSLGFSRQEHWSGLPFPSPVRESEKWKWRRSVMSDSWRPHGLKPTRLLPPWDFPGKSTGVGCHCLKEVYLKILCCHDDTWFHLNLTFLRPWANQCIFLMEMFFLIYVNETVYLLGNLPFCKIHVNHFMAWDNSPCANVVSKYVLWVRSLVPVSEFWDIPFL